MAFRARPDAVRKLGSPGNREDSKGDDQAAMYSMGSECVSGSALINQSVPRTNPAIVRLSSIAMNACGVSKYNLWHPHQHPPYPHRKAPEM